MHNPNKIFSLTNCLFGIAKLVRKAIKSNFIYHRWGIASDGEVSWSCDNYFARNGITFGVDNSW